MRNPLKDNLIEIRNIQKMMLENSLVGYYIAMGGKFYKMNPVALSYTGYALDEIIGRKADSLIHPADRKMVKKNARAMLQGERTTPHEFRIITKQKKICWVIEALSPILINGKKAILSNTMDITSGKRKEQELLASNNLYKTIFETTGTSTYIFEDDKTISLVNSQFEKLTGYRKEDWEGKRRWDELVASQDLQRMNRYHRERWKNPSRAPRTYECHFTDAKGKVKTVLSMVSLIPGTKKRVSSSMDITELKEKENELMIQSRALEEMNSALKVLLKQREEDRAELTLTLMSNMKDMIFPYIDKIRKCATDKKSLLYLDLMAANLEQILSPFTRNLSSRFMHLSPKEIQIANFVKDGKSSKEIAEYFNVTTAAVDVYRYRIRKKMGLKKQKINLQSYLKSL